MNRHRPAAHHDEPGRLPTGGAISLEWKLPLLMTALLAAGLAVTLAFTYRTLTRRAESIVRDRLVHAARQVASTAEASLAQRASSLRDVAADSVVKRVLLAARDGAQGRALTAVDAGAARSALARLAAPGDTALPVELWDADGRRVAFVGRDLPRSAHPAPPPTASAGGASPDAVGFGPLHADGDRMRFWAVAPVLAGGERVGFVAQARYVSGPRDAVRSLRELLREDVTLYMRNADGTSWVTAPGAPAAAPSRRDSTSDGVWYVRAGAGRVMAAESPIAGTPWVVVLESPESWIIRRPRQTVRALAVLGLAITVAGAAVAWGASRRITSPLASLTAAAEAVALGTYEHHVVGPGRDEIGRLTASFDTMARQVTTAREALEHRVTEAQAAAEELARANRQLREAMAEAERARADAERARAEAEAASRAKSDFLAVMSHELRTPLNAIGGYAQLLEMGLHGPVTDAQRNALLRIGHSQAHLLTLINDVLNFARIDAGQVEYAIEDVSLHDTLAELDTLVTPQVRASRLTFVYRPCPRGLSARADRDKLRQVVLNLLANAIKYTPEGGAVTVECDADDRHVRVHVRDTGTGIRAERLPFIFEPFVQGERALNRPDEGVGLGLAISRDLTRGMGGELSVASEVGQGSTFTVALPRAGVPLEPGTPGAPSLGLGPGSATTRA